MIMIRLVLDTDIGTDVDDCLALALILTSPEFHLEGVTCVYGDVLLRSRMVRKLLNLRGRTATPVFAGASQPLLELLPVYWAGHEGIGLLNESDHTLAPEADHAVDYLVRTVMSNPGQIHLAAIGPLTNVALALKREPRMVQALAGLTIMGGACRGYESLHINYVEHNIRCDPEAAHIVFSSGAPISLVPLDATLQTRIRPSDVERIRSAGTPFHVAVADQVALYPPFRARGFTHLHDPLAVATILSPDLVTWRALHVDVETGGRLTAGMTLMREPSDGVPDNARVALSVDAVRFEEWLLTRIAATVQP
ncbi:Inosine/uridine-preferring nucleoside hydrolase [Roseiflexus castenholzii DSM 13941]|jgi:purine nucleosidase|uniref:Inosine/uridine-preferring nucleoside hydrolase n=2 Tax=Roseiflexus castenholzii TaxID=120962 RepID=A7NM11_ROSCS|nr:Inosine/uridine-preferring nucleoside hydrolase [Roseiflexus castenholzii DSM 13941]